MFDELVKKIKENTKEGRELTYSEGAVGITSLLYCPLKWELRKKYPEVEVDAVEVDDGYLWEQQVKRALKELYGDSFVEEKVLEMEIDGLRIEGHLDCVVEKGDEVIGIELKSPKLLILRKIPEAELVYDDGSYAIHNEIYVTQARIQKFLLQKLYPDRKVRQYLFYKALAKKGTWSKKVYLVYEVKEAITEEELKELVRKFREEKGPRFPNECESYCEFYRRGLCEGREFNFEDGKDLDESVEFLLKEYRALQTDLKRIEIELKKKLKGSVRVGSRELGWVEKETVKIDEEKVLSKLSIEEVPRYFILDWRKKDELIERFGEEIVKERKVERKFRL